MRDPDGVSVGSGLTIQDLPLSPGTSSIEQVNFTPGAGSLGIWSLNYRLLDRDEGVVQGDTIAGHFIVSDPPVPDPAGNSPRAAVPAAPGTTDADVTLTLDQAAYAPGESMAALLDITLSDPGAVSALKVVLSLGETTVEQIVAASANQTVLVYLPADFGGNGLLFYGVYDSDTGEGLYLNTRWVQRAGDLVTVVPGAPTYAPGDTVDLHIAGDYTRTLFIEGADFARSIAVSGGISATFDLPAVLSSGPVKVQYQDGGFQRMSRFDVIGPRVTVTDMKTNLPIIAPGGEADIIATIVTDQPLDVRVTGHVVDGDGFIFPVVDQLESLAAGGQPLTLTLPISTTTSGSVRFEMTIADATETSVEYVQAHRYLTIDAPVLQAVRAENGQLGTSDTPEVILDWHAPSSQPVDVTVWLDGVQVSNDSVVLPAGFSSTRMSLPGGLAPGSYALYASADLGGGLTTTAGSTLVVVESAPGSHDVFLPMVVR